jgi:hypothetical protein
MNPARAGGNAAFFGIRNHRYAMNRAHGKLDQEKNDDERPSESH